MSKRLRIALSALCALVSVLACSLYAGSVREQAEQERTKTLERYGGSIVTLVVANRTIEAGEIVSTSDVGLVDWISSLAPEDALLSLDDVVGAEVSVPIAKNAPLCALNFRSDDQMIDIPSGHVAISVPVTEKIGLPSTVSVGSRVVAYRASEDATTLAVKDIIVLATPGSASTSIGKATLAIAVPAEHVAVILEASTLGDLRLVVPADDVKDLGSSPERVSEVLPKEAGQDQADKGEDKRERDGSGTDGRDRAESERDGHSQTGDDQDQAEGDQDGQESDVSGGDDQDGR